MHSSESIAAEIHGVFQRSYRQEADLLGLEIFPPLLRTKEQLRTAPTSFLGYWLESKLAAVVEFSYNGVHLSIDSLVVEPNHFRQGLASRLLEHLLAQTTWSTAVVETAAANYPAISLYQRLGFAESRRWRTTEGIEKIQLSISNGH